MGARELLEVLQLRGATLRVDGEQIRAKGVPADLREAIRAQRVELIALLSDETTTRRTKVLGAAESFVTVANAGQLSLLEAALARIKADQGPAIEMQAILSRIAAKGREYQQEHALEPGQGALITPDAEVQA